jgi:topoisomerase IA-like protein
MDAKAGDRISIDPKKVGQARRYGLVMSISMGLSGARYSVRWDDGSNTVFSPKFGNLIIERRGRGSNGKKTSPKKAAAKKAAPKAAKKPAKKPAQAKAGKKSGAKAKKPAGKAKKKR